MSACAAVSASSLTAAALDLRPSGRRSASDASRTMGRCSTTRRARRPVVRAVALQGGPSEGEQRKKNQMRSLRGGSNKGKTSPPLRAFAEPPPASGAVDKDAAPLGGGVQS